MMALYFSNVFFISSHVSRVRERFLLPLLSFNVDFHQRKAEAHAECPTLALTLRSPCFVRSLLAAHYLQLLPTSLANLPLSKSLQGEKVHLLNFDSKTRVSSSYTAAVHATQGLM